MAVTLASERLISPTALVQQMNSTWMWRSKQRQWTLPLATSSAANGQVRREFTRESIPIRWHDVVAKSSFDQSGASGALSQAKAVANWPSQYEEIAMPKLRHIALATNDPDKTAEF